jgi:hypothetical protein
VRATNAVGTGPNSAPSAALTARGVTAAATTVTATPSTPFAPTVTVSWNEPSESCAAVVPVTGYRVLFAGQSTTVDAGETSTIFGNVAPGSHAATVVAVNQVGESAAGTSSTMSVRGFAPFGDESSFIAQQYGDFLSRSPDAAGLGFWIGRTNDNRSNVSSIIEAFMNSPEFSPRRSISRLYLAFFDRAPDQGGFDFWAERIRSGRANLDTISQQFVQSPEFRSTYGSLSDGEFIALVYNNVLLRRPDQNGFDFWSARLAAGMTRGELMTRFSESPEFVNSSRPAVDVIVTYRGMLNREPDSGGFAFWVGRISNDQNSLRTLIAGFYSSLEYAGRITA